MDFIRQYLNLEMDFGNNEICRSKAFTTRISIISVSGCLPIHGLQEIYDTNKCTKFTI